MLKRIAATAATVATLSATILVPLAAADNQAENNTTGANSTNYVDIINKSNVTVDNVNDLAVYNDVTTRSNTGGNSCSMGTLGCSISTGDASNDTKVSTTGNINTTSIVTGPAGSGNTGENDTTGYASDNRIKIENETNTAVKNDNTAVVRNLVVTDANTGDNHGDMGTGPTLIGTGNADNKTNVINHLNDSAASIKAWPGGTGGNVARNSITGALSVNYIDIINLTNASVANVNDASVLNDVYARSNTGANTANMTTLGAEMMTGDASTDVGVGTTGNINTTTVAMAMGGFSDIKENIITGYLSDNRLRDENTSNVEVVTRNNKCSSEDCRDYDVKWGVVNKDVDVANTGDNDGSMGTGPSLIETGMSWLTKLIDVWMNDNFIKIE